LFGPTKPGIVGDIQHPSWGSPSSRRLRTREETAATLIGTAKNDPLPSIEGAQTGSVTAAGTAAERENLSEDEHIFLSQYPNGLR